MMKSLQFSLIFIFNYYISKSQSKHELFHDIEQSKEKANGKYQYNIEIVFINTRQIDKNSIVNKFHNNMTTNNAEQMVPEDIRDSTFKELKKINKNNICIDCEKKNPTWASIHLGIHLCIDCAGKHRQYGVIYSFVKSTNLDKWNRKQIMFMQKGGNQRALQYLTKCGVIGQSQKHIDYKSPIVQRYKSILTAQVDQQLFGKSVKTITTKQNSNSKVQKVQQTKQQDDKLNVPKQIPNAQSVQNQEKGKKKNKKKVGKKINLQDFDNLVLDDGVPLEEKQKIVKAYENSAKIQATANAQQTTNQPEEHQNKPQQKPQVEQPKQMTKEQAEKKLQQLKAKQNVKSISSEQFKDNSISSEVLKANLNKFHGSQSISSNQLFGGQDTTNEEGHLQKIKDFVSDAGGKLYGKLSSYWTKK